jgi:hypothetical protein
MALGGGIPVLGLKIEVMQRKGLAASKLFNVEQFSVFTLFYVFKT